MTPLCGLCLEKMDANETRHWHHHCIETAGFENYAQWLEKRLTNLEASNIAALMGVPSKADSTIDKYALAMTGITLALVVLAAIGLLSGFLYVAYRLITMVV